jgi:DNA-binding SARP family transcriptional activator
MTYRLQVLGSVALVRDGTPEPVLGMGKPLALITYLALSPKRTATREHLVDLLWADTDPESARRNLRQALYHIRRLVGAQFVVGEADVLTLSSDLSTDYHAFLAAVNSGDREAAVEWYAGPFFPAFAAPGGAEFERWADVERRRLHGIYLRALESLAREALLQHRLRDAERLARRLRDDEPERQTGWRLLIEALVSSGDWVRAAADADACEEMLRREGRAPEAATVAALRTARQTPTLEGSSAPRIIAEMVGREREFARIATAWDRATRGRFQHVHVVGTAGIGKTRLLTDTAGRMSMQGGSVIRIRASQGERNLPYALAADLTRALAELPGAPGIAPATAGVLVGLDPGLSARFPAARKVTATDGELLRLRTIALTDLVGAVASDHPVALLIDDLHWADRDSRRLLVGITTRLATEPVLLVTCTRALPDDHEWAPGENTLSLRPLTERQLEELIASIAVMPDDLMAADFIPALHAATEGSPLFVLETLQLASDRGLLMRDEGRWRVPDPHGLLRLLAEGSTLSRRLADLAIPERRLLLSVVVAGGPIADGLLATLTRKNTGGEAAPVRALEQRGFLVRREDGSWECAHDLITETLIEGATREELRSAHITIGDHLWRTAPEQSNALRSAVRHLARGRDDDSLHSAFTAYVRIRRRQGDRRPAAELAHSVLGDIQETVEITALLRALPVHLRITRPAAIGMAAAAALAVGALGTWWLSQPVELRVMQAPHFVEEISTSHPIIVEALNRLGTPAYQHADTVFLSGVDEGTFYTLTGAHRVPLENGRAIFSDVRFAWRPEYAGPVPGGIVLQLQIPGLGSVRTDTVFAGNGSTGVFLDSAYLNGRRVTPEERTVVLAPDDRRLTGTIHLRYRSNVGPAAVLLAAIPNWGDRTWNFGAARALKSRILHDTVHVHVDFPAPATPGRYWLALIAAAETEARFIASATNWSLGRPVWHDGDDLVDFGPDELRALETRGQVRWKALVPGPQHTARQRSARPQSAADLDSTLTSAVRGPRVLWGTVLYVIVE